jgi:hypothetical protein
MDKVRTNMNSKAYQEEDPEDRKLWWSKILVGRWAGKVGRWGWQAR